MAALGLLASYSWVVSLPMILYYNFLFTLPMILITGVVAFGTSPKKINELKEKYIRELHLIAGILLIAVLLMV